jgi:hypothetical protein
MVSTTMVSQDQHEMMDIIAETAEEDRERLMTICNDVIPNQIIFKERVILVTILTKTGHIDLHDEDIKSKVRWTDGTFFGTGYNTGDWDCSFDKDGHIVRLIIGENSQGYLTSFVLPPIIIHLVRIKILWVEFCSSLPMELSKLENLQRLYLGYCPDLFDNFPVQMELRNLLKLQVLNTIPESTSSPFFVWLATKLPSLHDLGFKDCREEQTNRVLDFLLTVEETRFKDNLRSINVEFCNSLCEPFETQLDTIFSEIRPRFSNLRSIKLPDNYIESIQPIVEKLETEQTVSSSLRVLSLYGDNQVLEKIHYDPKERAAAMSLIKTCSTIYNLGGCNKADYPSDLEYELRINHAGRNIIEVVGNDSRSVPISLWPTILERAYEKSHQIYEEPYSKNPTKKEKNATGLYYLLREGPALFGRSELGSGGDGDGDQSLLSSMLLSSISSSRKKRKIQTEIPFDLFNKCTPHFRDAWAKETEANKIDILGCKLMDSKKPPAHK